MHLPHSLPLLPLIAYPIAVAAAAAVDKKSWPRSNLTLELSAHVPVCAEDCFISFLEASFGLERGQGIPSLQELCSSDGQTGFTVGEGAVQCIAAERSVDGCADQDANSSVIYNAHQMCSDQPGAITPTHRVITATLVLPPSGQGPVSFPAPSSKPPRTRTRTSRTTDAAAALPSTLVVDTHSLTRTTTLLSASSTADTTVGTSAAETSTTTAAASAGGAAGGGSGTGGGGGGGGGGALTPLQKAGISVAVIGFAVIAAVLLLLFRLYRAKRQREHEHERLSETPSRRDSWGYGFDKNRGGGGDGHGHAGGETCWSKSPAPYPRAYSRTGWHPSAVGLAASPAASTSASPTPQPRPTSKLLPARPLLP
ncbi:hypothetical protein E4U41_001368, partial [Claviceps citrina]